MAEYCYVMKGLTKTVPGGKEVLSDIWLSFLPGAKIGVLGANGAGKSTLLRIMAGVDTEFRGDAQLAPGAEVPGEFQLIKNDRDARDNVYGAQENYEAEIGRGFSLWLWRAGLVLLRPRR